LRFGATQMEERANCLRRRRSERHLISQTGLPRAHAKRYRSGSQAPILAS
jgi:hypothetical protein